MFLDRNYTYSVGKNKVTKSVTLLSMEMSELVSKLKNFNTERNWDADLQPQDVAKSIIIEAAELLEHFQWTATRKERNQVEMLEINKTEIGEEIADVFIYLARLAYILNINIEEAVLDKIAKNAKKYPVEVFKSNKTGIAKKIHEEHRKTRKNK